VLATGVFHQEPFRQTVLDRLIEDGTSVQKLLAVMKRGFQLDKAEDPIYDCLHRQAARLNIAAHPQWGFSRHAVRRRVACIVSAEAASFSGLDYLKLKKQR